MRSLALCVVVALCLVAAPALAKTCTIGCPCGNTCIDCNDTCHSGSGVAGGSGGTDLTDSQFALLVVGGIVIVGGLTWLFIYQINNRQSAVAPLDVRPLDGGALVTTGFEF